MGVLIYFWLVNKIERLDEGMAVNILSSDMREASKIYMTSDIFDSVRPEYLRSLIAKLESDLDVIITELDFNKEFKVFKPKTNHNRAAIGDKSNE